MNVTPVRSRLMGAALALMVLFGCLALISDVRPASASVAGDESAFVNLINADRARLGRAGLTPDPAAANVARSWSQTMASQDRLYHNPSLGSQVTSWVTTSWTRVGENVGYGYSVGSIHDAFMNSQGHRENILGDYNRVGVGVAHTGSKIWVTVVFIKGPSIAPPPPAGSAPIGNVEVIQRVPGAVRVAGWSLDPDTAASTDVHVYIGPWGKAVSANIPRPDISRAFPGYGEPHGFDVTIPVLPGTHDVCVYGINAAGGGGNASFGCRRTTVNGTPVGAVDWVGWRAGQLTVAGWALDQDVEWSIDTHVYVDGRGVATQASTSRPDVGAAFPGYGPAHGFVTTIPVGGGRHTVCVYGIGAGAGGNSGLGCRTLDLPADPQGALDGVSRANGVVTASGWALDPETDEPIPVHVYARGIGKATMADQSRPDVAKVTGYSDRRGFSASISVPDGPVEVCAYGIGVGAGGNSLLGCRTV